MRTLIDFSPEQIRNLSKISSALHISRSSLVRQAVDDYLEKFNASDEDGAFGVWKHKKLDALQYQEKLRKEWD